MVRIEGKLSQAVCDLGTVASGCRGQRGRAADSRWRTRRLPHGGKRRGARAFRRTRRTRPAGPRRSRYSPAARRRHRAPTRSRRAAPRVSARQDLAVRPAMHHPALRAVIGSDVEGARRLEVVLVRAAGLESSAPRPPPHPARFARVRRELAADAADAPLAEAWFSVTVPGMCCLAQRTNASNTSPRALPFGVSV
jgi:hypothetical protein